MPKAKLRCETNTPEMGNRVKYDAADYIEVAPGEIQADFEHGQWWVTHVPSGAQWSVCDCQDARGREYFDFERVSEGDEEILQESQNA